MSQSRSGARRAIGKHAEEVAAAYLQARGLRPIARNYASRAGELDLVCLDRDELVFVEVRYRKDGALVAAPESITPTKQRRIRLAATHFIDRHDAHSRRRCRFDVVAVTGPRDRLRVQWITDAFGA